MKILIAGLGLIGGSMSKAFKKYTTHEIGGFDLKTDIIKIAKKEGSIDIGVHTLEELSNYDVVFLCLPLGNLEKFISDNLSYFKEDAIIADVSGVKGKLTANLTKICNDYMLNYISTHPMAGREKGGYENSIPDLFVDANFITTPVEETTITALEVVESLAKELRFRNFSRVSPEEHDRIIAYTSQLAHVVSAAYVKSPTMLSEKGFTGGSFQDMTRIATMNEDMWSELFYNNKEKLIYEIDKLLDNLLEYKKCLINSNKRGLRELIKEARLLKENDLKDSKFLTRFDSF